MNKKYDKKSYKKKREKKMNPNSKRCPYCGNEMNCRGASDSVGGTSWKCKNKKCGRTIWERRVPSPPEPLAPQTYFRRF